MKMPGIVSVQNLENKVFKFIIIVGVLPESIHDVIFDEGQLGVNLEHP